MLPCSCPNLPYFPMVYFGILKVGAVVVTLNVLLKPREIAYHCKTVMRRHLFVLRARPNCLWGRWGRQGLMLRLNAKPSS